MPLQEMSALRIEGPNGPIILRNIKRSRSVTSTPLATATVSSTIQDNMHCKVYRASINGHDVVIKLSVPHRKDPRSFADLEMEGKVYSDSLRDLQGTVIPRSYGFYRGSDASRRKICCLVMEDCGDPVQFLDKLDDADKLQVMQHLAAVHAKGYRLRDFAERNVVGRGGAYRLIDFHDMEIHDKCKWDGDLHAGEPRLSMRIRCNYMLVRGTDMHFWPSFYPAIHVSIGGQTYHKARLPPQETIDALLQDVDLGYIACNRPIVARWLYEYQRSVDDGTAVSVQDYKRSMPALPRKPPRKAVVLPYDD
ncbi:hypothetical protein PLICRDRAFT_126242 [Plicaturopsis crispa FD-325 SS-3]|nr:hypothetical protein PLICRDRAFT_126242 [Plicaturopsis crispa FD-325 SS-3]